MQDNIVLATNSMRSSVSKLRKRLSDLRIQVEAFDAEIEKINTKFENILGAAEIYKSKLEREMGREVRRLQKELEKAQRQSSGSLTDLSAAPLELKVASTIGIFESILMAMCEDAPDFRVASEAFLFPAVYERVITGEDEAYFLSEVPASATLLVERGKEYIQWLRTEYSTHVTSESVWDEVIPTIRDWWANDALPLLYGARDEQWDIDLPLSRAEIMMWRESPADRPLNFSGVFDAFEIYHKHYDTVYESADIRKFELTFLTEKT